MSDNQTPTQASTPTSAQTSAAPLPIALVGGAHIHAPGFIKRLKARNDVSVKFIWDHDAARARRRADEFGEEYLAANGTQILEEVGKIWRNKKIPAVVIASETNHHKQLVTAAARARKHVFAEKPLGTSSREAYAIAAAVEKSGVIFQTGYFMRSNPVNLFLRQQVQQGNFGKITRVRLSNCHGGALGGWFDSEWRWMADPAIAGCGGFGDLGTHVLDILLWLMGEVDRCTACLENGTARYPNCDETGEGLLHFKNGVIATLAAAWDDVADPCRILISGTEGHAAVMQDKLFFKSGKVEGADGKEPWTKLPEALPHAFELFLDAVTEKRADAPLVSVREAAYRTTVMEALYEGAKKQKWVMPKSAPEARAAAASSQSTAT